MLKLAFGLSYAELYRRDGLVKLDSAFLAHLAAVDDSCAGTLRPRLAAAREAPSSLDNKAERNRR